MKEENIKFRFASPEDVKSIVLLVRESFNELYLISSIYRCFGIESFISTEIKNQFSPYRYFVAEIDEKIVGFAEYKLFFDTSVAFLNMIAVDHNLKGRGIASSLFYHTKEFFSDQSFECIELDVFSSNSIALNWYISLGFSEKNTKSFYEYKGETVFTKVLEKKMVILNYPNFRCLYKEFGFSFLQILSEEQNVNIGIIDDTGIFRETLPEGESFSDILNMLESENIKKICYIGNEININDFTKISDIKRMKLNF